MRHCRSSSESEIRDETVSRLRRDLPGARIIHELNVAGGANRADLAAVSTQSIHLFEIKSEKDRLDRCEKQLQTFKRCGHFTILVAHEKWFEKRDTKKGVSYSKPACFRPADSVWIYPDSAQDCWGQYQWSLPRPSLTQPPARSLLGLLWRDELYRACFELGLSVRSRVTIPEMIDQLAWSYTGKDLCEAICKALRARQFAEADEPIIVEPVPTNPNTKRAAPAQTELL